MERSTAGWSRRSTPHVRWQRNQAASRLNPSRHIVLRTLVAALLLQGGSAWAHGNEGGNDGQRTGGAPVAPSRSVVEAWGALVAARDGIAEDIEGGRVDGIRWRARKLPELAQKLMQESGDLSAPRRSRVKGGVTQLSRVAEHLQEVAASGNADVLRGDLKRIDRALRMIHAQFPKDSLPLDPRSSVRARDHRDRPGGRAP